jgi:hypothetical protein
MLDEGAELLVRLAHGPADLVGQQRRGIFHDILDDVAAVEILPVVLEPSLEGSLALFDEQVPVEEQVAEILFRIVLELLAGGEDLLDQVLLLFGEEEDHAVVHRIHLEEVDQVGAELLGVEFGVREFSQTGRQCPPGRGGQGQVVVGEFVGIDQSRVKGDVVAGHHVHDLDMVTGEAGQHLVFRIEKLHAVAVVGHPEADKAVVDQARQKGFDILQKFLGLQIGGIEGGRLPGVLAGVALVAFEDEEDLLGDEAAEVTEQAGNAGGTGHGAEEETAVGVLQGGKGIPCPKFFPAAKTERRLQDEAGGAVEEGCGQRWTPLRWLGSNAIG